MILMLSAGWSYADILGRLGFRIFSEAKFQAMLGDTRAIGIK
jgi:hypothetical protein